MKRVEQILIDNQEREAEMKNDEENKNSVKNLIVNVTKEVMNKVSNFSLKQDKYQDRRTK